MSAEILDAIGTYIKEQNPYLNSFNVNAVQMPDGTVIEFTDGQEKKFIGIGDNLGTAGYIRFNPTIVNQSTERRLTSSSKNTSYIKQCRLVAFSNNKDLGSEALLTKLLSDINRVRFTGIGRAPVISIKNSNHSYADIIQEEYKKQLEEIGGYEFICVSIDFDLKYWNDNCSLCVAENDTPVIDFRTRWGQIVGDIQDQEDLIALLAAIPAPAWGNISGDITDQEDLIELIAAAVPNVGPNRMAFGDFITGNLSSNQNFIVRNGAATQSYSNIGGSGDRTSLITVSTNFGLGGGSISELINGALLNTMWFPSNAAANKTITFDFGAPRVITEITWYQNAPTSQGIWQFQGSDDDVAYTNIGATFNLDSGIINTMSANSSAYRYYRLLGISGATNAGPFVWEIQFKIDGSSYGFGIGLAGILPNNALSIIGSASIGHNNIATAFVDIAPSTTGLAGVRFRDGAAPSVPNLGEIWFQSPHFVMNGNLIVKSGTILGNGSGPFIELIAAAGTRIGYDGGNYHYMSAGQHQFICSSNLRLGVYGIGVAMESAFGQFYFEYATGMLYMPGKIQSPLPIGNGGLLAGRWYMDTAANVLANGDKVIAIKQ